MEIDSDDEQHVVVKVYCCSQSRMKRYKACHRHLPGSTTEFGCPLWMAPCASSYLRVDVGAVGAAVVQRVGALVRVLVTVDP